MKGFDLLAAHDEPPARNSPEERRRARLVVAWNALNPGRRPRPARRPRTARGGDPLMRRFLTVLGATGALVLAAATDALALSTNWQ